MFIFLQITFYKYIHLWLKKFVLQVNLMLGFNFCNGFEDFKIQISCYKSLLVLASNATKVMLERISDSVHRLLLPIKRRSSDLPIKSSTFKSCLDSILEWNADYLCLALFRYPSYFYPYYYLIIPRNCLWFNFDFFWYFS